MKLFKDLEKVLKMYGFKKVIAIPLDFSGRILFEKLKPCGFRVTGGPDPSETRARPDGDDKLGLPRQLRHQVLFRLFGDHIVVVDPDYFGRDGNPGKIGVWRVADGETHALMPCDRWVLEGRVTSRDLVGANRVQVRGNYAYVAGSQYEKPSRTAVVDLTDPTRLRLAATLPFSDVRGPNGLTVAGNVMFAAGGQTIEAIDIRDPDHPIKLAAERLLDVFPVGRDDAHDLVYRQGYLYVTAQNSNRFAILKIHSSRILELAATCDPLFQRGRH